MPMLFEILFDRKKAKAGIAATKADAVNMLKDVEKQAKKTGTAIDEAMRTQERNQRKWVNQRMTGDAFTQAAAQNPAFRQILNQALGAGMLGRSDLRGISGRKGILANFRSGELKRQLEEYKKFGAQTEKVEDNVTKNSMQHVITAHKINEQKKKFHNEEGKRLQEHEHRLNTAERLEGNYFSRLRRQIVDVAVAYFSYETARKAAEAIFESSHEREQSMFRNSVAFGNKANASAAYSLAQRMGTTGTPFRQADLMQGFQQMMEMGVDPRKNKNFRLFGNMAAATGNTLSQTTSDISSAVYGNNDVMRKYGFTNAQIFALQHMVDQRPNYRQSVILQMLSKDKRYDNGMRDFAQSWDGMLNQMKNHWDKFLEAIAGKPEDKNSLYYKLKQTFQSVINWFQRNGERIERFGKLVGTVLKRVLIWTTDFAKAIGRNLERILGFTDGTEQSFQDKTNKIVLWLELTKIKVVDFFEKWKWLIKDVVEVWIGVKLFQGIQKALTLFKEFSIISTITESITAFREGLAGVTVAEGMAARGGAVGLGAGAAGGGLLGAISSFIMSPAGILLIAGAAVLALAVMNKKSAPPPTDRTWQNVTATRGPNLKGNLPADIIQRYGSPNTTSDKMTAGDLLDDARFMPFATPDQKKLHNNLIEQKSIMRDFVSSGDKTLDSARINRFLGSPQGYSATMEEVNKYTNPRERENALNDILGTYAIQNIDKVYITIQTSDVTKAGQIVMTHLQQLMSRGGQGPGTNRKASNQQGTGLPQTGQSSN